MRLGLLTRTFTPELVDLVVEEAGAREEQTRSLPSTLMVYFTLAMWLFTGQGYALVLREMVENIPRRAGERWRAANAGSLAVALTACGSSCLGHCVVRDPGGGGLRCGRGRESCPAGRRRSRVGLLDGLGVRLEPGVLGEHPADARHRGVLPLALCQRTDQVGLNLLDGLAVRAAPQQGVEQIGTSPAPAPVGSVVGAAR